MALTRDLIFALMMSSDNIVDAPIVAIDVSTFAPLVPLVPLVPLAPLVPLCFCFRQKQRI